MSEVAAFQAVYPAGLMNGMPAIAAPTPQAQQVPVTPQPIQQAQQTHIAPGLYNNMASSTSFQTTTAVPQNNGFANMNTQPRSMNVQSATPLQQQPLVNGSGFGGVHQYSNGAIQANQQQQQLAAATPARPIAPAPAPALAPTPAPVHAPVPAPPPPKSVTSSVGDASMVVDLTASDDSPKVVDRDINEMATDLSPSPFDDLGKTRNKSPPSSSRPMNIRASTPVDVPRVPADYVPPRVSSATTPDSSSFYQAPSERPPKRPAPTTTAGGSSSKHKFLGPSIPNNPALGDLAPLVTAGALRREKPYLLFKYLRKGWDDELDDEVPPLFQPTPQQVIMIVQALQNGATNSYLQKMADNEDHTEVIVDWIKAMSKNVELYEAGITPLFNLLARTNMPVNYIEDYKLRKLTDRLRAKAEEKGLRSMPEIERAYNRYFNYLQDDLLRKNRRTEDDDGSDDEPVVKKRKTDIKPDIGKSDVKPVVKAAKADVKPKVNGSGMSFFSGPPSASTAPKAKVPNLKGLPSFKKRPAPLQTTSAAAGPSRPGGSSLLASTMKRLKNDPSPPPSAVSPMEAKSDPKPVVSKAEKLNRKGHTVRWVDHAPGYSPSGDRPLVAIREFTEAPHELEPAPWRDEMEHGVSVHELDKREGNQMHHRVYDEVEVGMEWADPIPYDPQWERPAVNSTEAGTQEERERSILAVSYIAGQEPITPDDIGVRIVAHDTTTSEVNKYHHYAGSPSVLPPPDSSVPVPVPVPGVPAAPAPTSVSVSDLLSKLSGNIPGLKAATPAAAPAPVNQPYGAADSYDYNAGPSSSSSSSYGYAQQPQTGYGAPSNRWDQARAPGLVNHHQNHQGPSHAPGHAGQGYHHSNRGGWGGGARGAPRGGGGGGYVRGYRTRVCKFWRENKCQQGDACTFLHEMR